jgi:hypothetical protein
MADARSAWNDAGERLTELGQKLKTHYAQQHGTEGEQTREEVADAARRLGGAVQDAFETIGKAAKDKSVQADVKQVGQSVFDALTATFGQVSEELKRSLSQTKGEAAAKHRTVTEGTVTEGTVTEGTVTEGAVTEGTVTEGTVTEGTVTEGTVTEGSVPPEPAGTSTTEAPTTGNPTPGEPDGGPPKVEPWGTP